MYTLTLYQNNSLNGNMKTYRKKYNVHHVIVYSMSMLLTVAVILVWIIKGTVSVQVIASYLLVLAYAISFYLNRSYVMMDTDSLIIVKGNGGNRRSIYVLKEIKSVKITKSAFDFCLEIDTGSRLNKERVSLFGREQIDQFSKDLMEIGIKSTPCHS